MTESLRGKKLSRTFHKHFRQELILADQQDIIHKIKSISEELGFYFLQNEIEAIDEFYSQNSFLDVAILGQFKTGKSSFINNLINAEILPVGVTPVTAVITRIQYGEKVKITVFFSDGSKKEINTDEIEGFVSETKNPLNAKNVSTVDIELPYLQKFKGLRFIDTPGIDSLFKHNTITTKKWIVRSNIAFMVISAERPLSEGDITMAEEILEYTPELIILITKSDLFSEDQLNEISSFIDSNLKKRFSKNFKIFRYSIFKNNQIYKKQITEQLLLPVIQNLDSEYCKIKDYKVNTLSKSCLSYLFLAKITLEKDDAEKNNLKKLILDEKLNSDIIRKDLQLIYVNYISITRDTIYKVLCKYEKSISSEIQEKLVKEYINWKGNISKLSVRYESFLKSNLESELRAVILKEQHSIKDTLDKANRHFTNYLNSFRRRLNDNIFRVLGMKLNEENKEISYISIILPDISISRVFDVQIDLIWFLFPVFIFGNMLKKHFIKQIPQEVEKNIHRLTSDLTEKINKEIDKIRLECFKYISLELNSIESILASQKNNSFKIQSYIDYLNPHSNT